MSEKYRVVLTCWEPDTITPYADYFSEVDLSLFPTEDLAQHGIEQAIRDELITLNNLQSDNPNKKEPVLDSDGCIIGYDYPFRGDFSGAFDGIVRLWDGDDYRNVTAYTIHRLTCDSDDIDKCSYYKYRGFWIIPNEAHTSFKVEQFDTVLFRSKSLEEALREIDTVMVDLTYGARSRKDSIDNLIHSASNRAAECQHTSSTKSKELDYNL